MALPLASRVPLGAELRVHHEGTKGTGMDIDALSHSVIGAALEVHQALGPGVSDRADSIVERQLILEVRSVAKLEGIHSAQVLTYLKLTGSKTGLLINFNTQSLRSGVIRVVH